MIRKLELTEAQIKKLREADFTSREKRLELAAQRDRLELQMEKAFSEDTVDEKTVLKLAEKISDVRGDLFLQRMESRLAIGKILSTDQMNKLKQHRWQKKKCNPRAGRKSRASNHSA
jgi:Spy/CpxP family protein refolding chaperone